MNSVVNGRIYNGKRINGYNPRDSATNGLFVNGRHYVDNGVIINGISKNNDVLVNLDFVRGTNIDRVSKGGLTLSTPVTTRYFMNSSGVLTAMDSANFSPAYTNAGATLLGLLRGPEKTNLITNSSIFGGLTGLSVKTSNITGPDGNTYVDQLELVEDTSTAIFRSTPNNIPYVAGTVYTTSVFCKRGVGARYPGIRLNSLAFGANYGVVFNPDTETVAAVNGATNIGFEKFANGWYRIWITATATSTTSTTPIFVTSDVSNNIATRTGDGISSIYFFGKQVETGSLTSYIPTSGSAITRASEQTGAYTSIQLPGNFDQSRGTVAVKLALGWNKADISSMTARAIIGVNGVSSSLIYLAPAAVIQSTDGSASPFAAGSYLKNTPYVIATKWSSAGFAVGHNISGSFVFGTSSAYDGAFAVDGGGKIVIIGGDMPGDVYIQAVHIWNRVLTATEIERAMA